MRKRITPEDADRLIDGSPPEDLEPVADALSGLRAAFTRPPDDATRASHLSRMLDVQPEGSASPAPARKPRRVVRGTVAAAGFVLVGGSALAATGTLPTPVQNVVADAVDEVVDLPGGSGGSAKGGSPTNPRAAANKAEAEAFTAAKKEWLACVKAARAAHEAETGGDVAPFGTAEAEAACGPKPHPHDFRTDAPEKSPAADETPKPTKSPEPTKSPKPERTEKPSVVEEDDGSAGGRPEKTPRLDNPNKPDKPATPAKGEPADR